MDTTKVLQQFKELTSYYVGELNKFSTEQLTWQPSQEEWSIGQMYQHLVSSALHMHLRNIEHCLNSNKETLSSGDKTKEGVTVFEQGKFPPIRIKVQASPQYTPEQPRSKEQLIQGINLVVHRMEEIAPKVEKASKQNKVPHPGFGALNAKEWFQLIEMHYRHHLLQLERLKRELESNHNS